MFILRLCNKDELLSPFVSNAFSYYHFYLMGRENSENGIIYKIRFVPRQSSPKLVFGYVYVVDKKWSIDKLDVSGGNSFQEFNLMMSFNRMRENFFLPQNAEFSKDESFG
jgi:hypothetical protein